MQLHKPKDLPKTQVQTPKVLLNSMKDALQPKVKAMSTKPET